MVSKGVHDIQWKRKQQLSTQNLVDHVNREAEIFDAVDHTVDEPINVFTIKDIAMILILILKVIMEVLMKMKQMCKTHTRIRVHIRERVQGLQAL